MLRVVVGWWVVAAAVICAPISLIKTRFEAASTAQYRGVLHALRTIARGEGLRGLYAGIGPTLTRDAPYAGLHLVFYTRAKAALTAFAQAAPASASSASSSAVAAAAPLIPPTLIQFASGFVAGGAGNLCLARCFLALHLALPTAQLILLAVLCVVARTATAITHPFDVVCAAPRHTCSSDSDGRDSRLLVLVCAVCVCADRQIKTRIQVERLNRLNQAQAGAITGAVSSSPSVVLSAGAPAQTLYGSRSLAAAKAIVLESGPIGLSAGMVPRLLKRALSNAITWTLFEQTVSSGRGKSGL